MSKFYRDDDINVYTCVEDFRHIHDIFRKYNRMHTVACEMFDLWENKALFWLLVTDPLINVELHGWRHTDFSTMPPETIETELRRAVNYWDAHASRMLGGHMPETKRLSTFFPPWNRVSPALFEVASKLNLRVSYLPEDCHWSFHWWSTNLKEVEEHLQ